ncbi:MAG: DUF1990 family protein [Bryobacteraceae bacterium]
MSAPFSYPEVGATRDGRLPHGYNHGYNIDRRRVRMGAGLSTFAAAKAAFERWEMFNKSWMRVFPGNAAIREGVTVAVVPAHFGFYSINVSRIVYVIETETPIRRFGFAYGTLPEHVESGEERFTVSWDSIDDSVWYEIVAFSRPRAILARIGYPVSRALQRKFGRTSVAGMMEAVRVRERRA